mmetsp:Transcript_37731/g.97920  ORF Transcript_37731/g.97920 Transcript_37731/m.97920 type:complete len:339 (+) Transcript_37731:247-1263(+)
MKAAPLYLATPLSSVTRSGAIFSQTFFLGLSTSSGSPSYPSKVIRSPLGTPSGGAIGSTWSCALLAAQSTMPYDMTSLILAGFRLQTTTTRRFSMPASGTNFTSPLTTCRGLSSPRSISSQYSASALGWRHTLVMVPTRMSAIRTDTSTSAFGGGGAFSFFSFFPLPPSADAPLSAACGLAAAASAPLPAPLPASLPASLPGLPGTPFWAGAASRVALLAPLLDDLALACSGCAAARGLVLRRGLATATGGNSGRAAGDFCTISNQRSRLHSWSVCAAGSAATAALRRLKTRRSASVMRSRVRKVRDCRCSLTRNSFWSVTTPLSSVLQYVSHSATAA